MSAEEHSASVSSALPGRSGIRPRGGKSYTDELQDHWQAQFTEKAADPTSAAYTEHNSGLGGTTPVGPPPSNAAAPTSFYEPPPAQSSSSTGPVQVPSPNGGNGPALFTPPDMSGQSSSRPAAQSRYPDPQAGGYNYGGNSTTAMGGSIGGGMGGSGMGDGGMGGGGMGGGGMGGQWDGQDDSGYAPDGPASQPVEIVKKEIVDLLMQAKVKLQIDQNAQIAAGVAAFVTLILLFLLGIWLLVLVGLGVSGAVGYRVSQLKKAQAAGQGVSSFEKGL